MLSRFYCADNFLWNLLIFKFYIRIKFYFYTPIFRLVLRFRKQTLLEEFDYSLVICVVLENNVYYLRSTLYNYFVDKNIHVH